MKKINKAKLIARIIEIIVVIVATIIFKRAIIFCYGVRGYKAIGGEYSIPFFAIAIIYAIESILDHFED